MKQTVCIITASLALLGCGGDNTAQGTPYPLTTCIVSGESLGSHGETESIVHEGQEIIFCCAPCIKKFKNAPAKYLAKLEANNPPKK